MFSVRSWSFVGPPRTTNDQRRTTNYDSGMSLTKPLLAELEFESATTIKMLERVPREQFEWRPHAKSMALGQLAWHIATIPKTVGRLLGAGGGGRMATAERRSERGASATSAAWLAESMPLAAGTVDGACFAVAGPVIGNTAKVTNLGWTMDAEALAARFSIARVALI